MLYHLPALALLLAPWPGSPDLGTARDDGAPTSSPRRAEALAGVPLLDLDGRQVAFGTWLGEEPTVLAYTGVGCPISGKYARRLTELARTYAARGVRFVAVNANPQDSRADVAREREELGLGLTVLKDFRQALTRALGARTTTEVFLFDAEGALRYHGAIDDQYSLGASRPTPTKTWLVDALEAVLAGEAPAVEATEAPGCALTLVDEEELPEAITWSGHVARIVQQNCEACHRPGQVGPFALQTYDQAKGWAAMIGDVVEEGRMPPWNAETEFHGTFRNERFLPAKDKARLLRWIADGMPRGVPAEDPPAVDWPEGWLLAEPDAVFTVERMLDYDTGEYVPVPERGFEVPRDGTVEYQYFRVKTSYPEDRWIRSIEVRPGAADVVHHVLILVDDPSEKKPFASGQLDYRKLLAGAVPGEISYDYPEGYAKRLPAGCELIFQLHYTTNGKQRFDRSSVAMVFADEPPIFEVLTTAVVEEDLRIPPGAKDFEVRAELPLYEDTAVIAFLPHMHTRGKDFRYVAHYPDGSSEDLLRVDYDFNWQETYIYPDPHPLPPDTVLEVVGHFDNSADNPNNPDPTEWVEWGDQTWEEMFIGYFDYVRFVE